MHCVSRCFGAFLEPVVGAICTLLRLHCLLLMVRGCMGCCIHEFPGITIMGIVAFPCMALVSSIDTSGLCHKVLGVRCGSLLQGCSWSTRCMHQHWSAGYRRPCALLMAVVLSMCIFIPPSEHLGLTLSPFKRPWRGPGEALARSWSVSVRTLC